MSDYTNYRDYLDTMTRAKLTETNMLIEILNELDGYEDGEFRKAVRFALAQDKINRVIKEAA